MLNFTKVLPTGAEEFHGDGLGTIPIPYHVLTSPIGLQQRGILKEVAVDATPAAFDTPLRALSLLRDGTLYLAWGTLCRQEARDSTEAELEC